MSVVDPILVYYDEGREMWRLLQGRETFYDEGRAMREWPTQAEAVDWALSTYPKASVVTSKEGTIKVVLGTRSRAKVEVVSQLSLWSELGE